MFTVNYGIILIGRGNDKGIKEKRGTYFMDDP